MPIQKMSTQTRSNIWLLLIPVVVLSVAGLVVSSNSLIKAQSSAAPMTQYQDPQGRFTILYPTNWTATPQADRFQTELVKFDNGTGVSAVIILLGPQNTDPETLANYVV